MGLRFSLVYVLGPLFLACSGQEKSEPSDDSGNWSSGSTAGWAADSDADGDPDAGTEEEVDGSADDGSDGVLTPADMPPNPGPFTVSFSDGTSLEFDLPSCSHYRGSTNFRMFWRNEDRSHVYVMIIEAMSVFDGVGSYSSNDGTVRVKLQQEAGGTSGDSAYKSDGSDGSEVLVRVDYLDEDIAWGEATITTMHDTTQDVPVDVTPTTFPIWCSDLAI